MSIYRTPAPRPVEPSRPLLERLNARWLSWLRSRETPLERKRREMIEALEQLAKTYNGQRALMQAMARKL